MMRRETKLIERAHRMHAATGEPIVVYENPTPEQLAITRAADPRGRGQVKGLLTMDDDRLFIWPAWYAHHGDIIAAMGLSYQNVDLEMGEDGPMLSPGGTPEYIASAADIVNNSETIQRIYGLVPATVAAHRVRPAMMGLSKNPPTSSGERRSANAMRKRIGLLPLR